MLWEEFRPALERVWERVWRKPDAERKPMDAVLMFKTLVLSALYNLSDEPIEYQLRDRLSFMRFFGRFLGLGLEDRVPDAKTVWLYRSEEMEARLRDWRLRDRKLKSHIHRKGKRGKPLTAQAKGSKRTKSPGQIPGSNPRAKSKVRARVEHVFGAQTNDIGGTMVRTIGIAHAKAQIGMKKIGMKNIAYNMRRLIVLRRINPCPA